MNSVIPNNTLLPNRGDVQTFLWVVFGYLDADSYAPFRSFAEKGSNGKRPPQNSWINADEYIVGKAYEFVQNCNKSKTAAYVIPGVVAKQGQARAEEITQMQVLLVDIDEGDTEEKLLTMQSALGQATMVVESGGVTNCVSPKLHVYWQLEQPVSGDDLQTLLDLRYKLAISIGGDIHFKSAHQPIRLAGSVYYKGGIAKLVKIRSYSCMEYSLEELIQGVETLEKKRSYLPSLSSKSSLKNASNEQNNINADKITNTPTQQNTFLPVSKILTTKVYEGASGEHTRFNHITKAIGYFIRRAHDGFITEAEAIDEIYGFNQTQLSPPWPIEKLNDSIKGLWNVHVKKNGEPKMITNDAATAPPTNAVPAINSFSLKSFLKDNSELPQDIIAPRILTPNGMLVFGGAPKVGKSDFLLSLLTHMAAGKEFLGFVPLRPLKIFYFQAEIGYHYLRERLQNMQLSEELISIADDNLHITPNTKLLLTETTIESLAAHILAKLQDKPDIIAIDPIRNVFDGGRLGATENDNDAMMFFLQRRVEVLRDKINPNAGIILVHHTKKMTKAQFDEDPFQAFSGASSLRGYYTSGVILHKPDTDKSELSLIFELRNGKNIPTKMLNKDKDNKWYEENSADKRIAYEHKGSLYDRERARRINVIIEILRAEALQGRFYLMKQFAEKFQNQRELGGKRAIYDDCSVAATQGLIMFFDNPEIYGKNLTLPSNASFGFMWCESMNVKTTELINNVTGEITEGCITVFPTHYKCTSDGSKRSISEIDSTTVNSTYLEELREVNN